MNTCEVHWKWFCLLSCLLAACVGERKADPSWAPHSVCVTISASWQQELGEFFFPLFRTVESSWNCEKAASPGRGCLAWGEGKQCRTKAVSELWLWLSREQSLCCWGCTRHHALMECDASNGQTQLLLEQNHWGCTAVGLPAPWQGEAATTIHEEFAATHPKRNGMCYLGF